MTLEVQGTYQYYRLPYPRERALISEASGKFHFRHRPTRTHVSSRGQSLVEFSLVLPILLVLFAGIVQMGAIYAAKHALIQVARDTGRWAATQINDPCNAAASATPAEPLTKANLFASQSGMLGYSSGNWNSAGFHVYSDNQALPSTPFYPEGGVEVVWSREGGGACVRPIDNTVTEYVTVRVTHAVPLFIPGIEYLPISLSCRASGCTFPISATAKFRMEPQEGR